MFLGLATTMASRFLAAYHIARGINGFSAESLKKKISEAISCVFTTEAHKHIICPHSVLVTENRGRSQKKEREKSRSKSKSRYKNVECHYCHKTGHIQKHCFLRKKDNKGKNDKLKEKDHDDDDRVTTATGDDLVILRGFESINLVSNESMSIINSSATLHVTPRKEFFTSYTSGDFGVVKMGNDGVTKAIGVGDVCLQTNMGVQLWLRGVKHVPDFHFNLIVTSVERQSCKKVKCIRFDNGGEYCRPFDVYCKKQGIRHEKTPPKTPQLNGLAERMNNKSLIERVRCMLSEAKLPKHLWGKALYTSVIVINLGPTVVLNTKVPNKIWIGKYVKNDHLRVFGCKAFVHVSKDERSKLDMKTRQCIFIGYGQDEYGYKLYDSVEKKLVRSCDVQFMEDQTIKYIDKIPVHDLDIVENNVQNGEQHDYGVAKIPYENAKAVSIPLATHFKLSFGHSPSNKAEKTNMRRASYASTVGREHQNAVKWIFRYLHGTSDLRLCFGGDKPTFVRYSDSDMARDIDSRKSTLGYLIKFKHIDVRYHWIRDALDAKLLELTKVHTDDNDVDMMTKAAFNYVDKNSIPSSTLSLSYKRRRGQIEERQRESVNFHSQRRKEREGDRKKKKVPETLTIEKLGALRAPSKSNVPIIEPFQLVEADDFVFGFPTRFEMMLDYYGNNNCLIASQLESSLASIFKVVWTRDYTVRTNYIIHDLNVVFSFKKK
ncbi:hypothetical protein CR513_04408, partial [Mucuna pruriens]